ncbi:MAG: hypothetical protein ACRDG4_10140, partial [Chloroflexota bacterium]
MSERRAVLRPAVGLSVLLVLLILLPFVLGYLGTPAGYVFRGTLKPSGDESQYLAAVRMGMRGAWLWHDPYMAQAPPPILMYPLYLLAGHVAAPFTNQVGAVFALFHAVSALVLAAALWWMGALFLDRRRRAWFVAFSLLAGGLYWLVALLAIGNLNPIGLSAMGTERLSAFTALLMEAHVALGTAGQVMAFVGILGSSPALGRAGRRNGAVLGCAGVALVGLSLPVLLPLTLVVVAAIALERLAANQRAAGGGTGALWFLSIAALICLPGLAFGAYYYHVFSVGPWSRGGFQGVPASTWAEKLLTWGVLLPFGWWGLRRSGPRVRPLAHALAIWVGCSVVGSFLPFWQGDRLTLGVSVPIGALFALGAAEIGMHEVRARRRLLLLGAGPICHYLFLCIALLDGASPNLYAAVEEDRAARWIAAHVQPGEVVLAPFGFANTLPTIAPVQVPAGHGYQTLDIVRRQHELNEVYGGHRTPAQRLAAARATGADLLVYDRLDTANGTFDARTLPGTRI